MARTLESDLIKSVRAVVPCLVPICSRCCITGVVSTAIVINSGTAVRVIKASS